MKLQRLLAVALALPAMARAEDPAKQLDPERVRTLLIADASERLKVELRLEFRQAVRFESTREARTEDIAVHVKLNGTLHAGSSYQLQTGGARTSLLIEHGDKRYDAACDPSKTWISSTGPRGESRTRPVGLVGLLRYPVLDQMTWAEFLEQYPIVEASMEGDELTVFFAVNSTNADWIKKRSLDSIGGCVGWRCVLCKSGERFRLTRVETISTTYRLVADPATGGVKRVPQDDYIAKRGRRRINGMDEFGVFRYVDFEQFKALAGFDLPMRVVEGGTESVMTAEIDPLTLHEDVTFKDDDFAFRPPRSLGERGIHTDKEKGTTTYFGQFDGGSDGLVKGLIEGARRLGARESPTADTRALWWILGIGGALTGLAFSWWRRHSPNRATRSPA